MSSNFERLHEIINQAYAENFSILTQKMANPLLNPPLHFLIGIPFFKLVMFFINQFPSLASLLEMFWQKNVILYEAL